MAMMVLRAALALTFLGITSWFQIRDIAAGQYNFYPLYAVVVVIGLLTILYAATLNRAQNLTFFAYAQVTADIVIITMIVYVTGGADSYLHVLYPLSIIGSAVILDKRGGYYAAAMSSMFYAVVVDLDFFKLLSLKFKVFGGRANPVWEDVFTTLATNVLAYFTIAYLAGYLVERTARAEKKLVEKEGDYDKLETLNRYIVENISSGIMTLDSDLRVTSFNRGAEVITGYPLRDVYCRDAREVFPGILDDPARLRKGVSLERCFMKTGGVEVCLEYNVLEGRGNEASYIVIFNDLTEKKSMEERLRMNDRLRALGELSVGIAHEIRNPLASISGSIQVLKNELDLGGENLHLMEIVLRETERLNSLISDYLLFARPAKGKREIVNLSGVIAETVKMFKNCPEAADIEITNSVLPDVYVFGDARQLGQVFWNLFLNASHAMDGGGSLNIESRFDCIPTGDPPSAPLGANVLITVSDTGKGIPPEALNRIFDPFFSTKDTGTGLGLAIVHRVVESHGGRVEVKSNAGRGSAFMITLPVYEAVEGGV